MSSLAVYDYCLVANGERLLPAAQSSHTFVVTGASRGGTSAIAYILARNGIDLGACGQRNHEDRAFAGAIRANRFDESAVSRHIADRNRAYSVWGLKLPAAVFYLSRLEPMLRAPIFFMVYRNEASIARSKILRGNHFSATQSGLSGALRNARQFYDAFVNELPKLTAPVICLEYEHLTSCPNDLLGELYELLGWPKEGIDDVAAKVSQPPTSAPMSSRPRVERRVFAQEAARW